MKLLALLAIGFSIISCAYSDTWAPPTPSGFASASGQYVLRILPGDGAKKQKPKAIVFEISSTGNTYEKKREFPLVNQWAPVTACISNQGEVYTFNSWGRMGYEHVLVWYGADGKLKKEFTLEQLFPAKQLTELKEEHRSVSSIHWLKGAPSLSGQYLIMNDSLGGYVSLSAGIIEYVPKEEK